MSDAHLGFDDSFDRKAARLRATLAARSRGRGLEWETPMPSTTAPRAATKEPASPPAPRAPPPWAAHRQAPSGCDGSGAAVGSDGDALAAQLAALGVDHAAFERANEILDFAVILGVDPESEAHLLPLAEEFWLADLPEGWEELVADDDGTADADTADCVYYAHVESGTTQWEHPLEEYYRGAVFMRRGGEAALARAHAEQPPTVADMAEYLGIDLKAERYLGEIVRNAVGAPLPPGWYENHSTGKYLHGASGQLTDTHPLDAYFAELVRRARADRAARVKGGASAGPSHAQREEVTRIIAATGDCWAVLGAAPGATPQAVRQRYRAAALLVHPDKCAAPEAGDAFKVLTSAFRDAIGRAS